MRSKRRMAYGVWRMTRTPSLPKGLLAGLVLVCGLALGATPLLVQFSSAPAHQIPSPWRVVGVPGGKVPLTSFALTQVDGRRVVQVSTASSYGNLVHDLAPAPSGGALRLAWSWQLVEPLPQANLRTRQGDDSPLKVCVLFDMPPEHLGLVERNLLRLARMASSEKLPAATLCYVWDATLAADTLLSNAYTARVRMLVVQQGGPSPQPWVMHSRDLSADFLRAFGAETATVPPILAVLVGGDSDNTGGRSLGYVGDIHLER